MADDVKVKFGGDFSDVAKGAKDAVSKAGASIGSWWDDFAKSTTASVTSALALSTLFGKFTESVKESMQYFRELELGSKRFNSGLSPEFQKVARYGAEMGVSIESVGRTMTYFNKVRAEAAKGNQTYISILKQMGFSEEEIKSGNISAIEVLGRLADAYDKTGYESLVAQRAMAAFGIKGGELAAIFKNGRESLEAFTNSIGTMSEESVKRLSRAQLKAEEFQRTLYRVFVQAPLEILAGASEDVEISTMYEAIKSAAFGDYDIGLTAEKPSGGGTWQQQAASDVNQMLAHVGGDIEKLKLFQKEHRAAMEGSFYSFFFGNEDYDKALEAELSARISGAQKKQSKTKPGIDIPIIKEAMTASTLQSIGAGDVSSIMAGTYQASMLSAMQQTADNTQKIATQGEQQQTNPPPAVAR